MRLQHTILWSAGVMLFSSCSDIDSESIAPQSEGKIIAVTESPAQSRTCVDGDVDTETGILGLKWTAGDELGVFASSGAQVRYTKSNTNAEAKATFVPQGDAIAPRYAYYPYSADNDGLDMTSLKGTVPEVQAIDGGVLQGDYKIGRIAATVTEGYEFEFMHLFSLLRIEINAAGTELAGETLKSVEMSLTRGGQNVAITGDFNFNVRTAAFVLGNFTSNKLTMAYNETAPALDSKVVGYVSLFPNVIAGDEMTVTIATDKHTAKFNSIAKIDFKAEGLYNFPIELAKRDAVITSTESGEPESRTGTFTCATYNVDGLPSSINSGGPGTSGTTQIGKFIAADNWDFFGVSENFSYNDELWAEISGTFNQGTYRKATLSIFSTADTDGLNFYWRKNGVEVGGETIVEYTSKYGGLTDGANTSVKKGFRHYEVSLSEDVIIDVYITHMNTYSSSGTGHINAQHAQLEQLRDYVIAKAKANKRPAIIMGDTNLRYTRHKIKELLIDKVNEPANAMEIVDPWVSLVWGYDFSSVGGSNYPLYGGKSLMVSDATGTDADTDVIISEAEGGLQKGEVVDKIFYINCKDANTQIAAKSYLRDVSYKNSDNKPLADHYPVVVEFEYTTK